MSLTCHCFRGFTGFLMAGLLLWSISLAAVEPDEMLEDPRLESRARDLSEGVRCLVCQNESIDSSNADLARELRLLIRERIVAGDSDEQVLDYLVDRYGDFVLLKPPVRPGTYLLWFGPALLLVIGLAACVLYIRQRRPQAAGGADPLSAAEQERLSSLLAESGAPENTREKQE